METQALTLAEPETALTVHQPPQPPSLFGTSDPAVVVQKATAVANTLKGVIKQQKLISVISGKEYPRCEAWTLLGTMLGVFPVLIWTRKLDTGWEARVEARTRDGAVVGAAEAQCLNTERNWSNRDDFALRSMAQTRATAKCLRMPLGFVMTLAGLEPTPAEEMTYERQEPLPPVQTRSEPKNPATVTQARPTATEDQRRKLIGLWELEGKDAIHSAHGYFIDCGAILPTESLSDIPLRWVPVTTKEVRELGVLIASGKAQRPPWVTNDTASSRKPENPIESAKSPELPREPIAGQDAEGEEVTGKDFPMPFGKNAGKLLGKLPKNYLFGLWANFKVETEYNGKPKKPETIAKDRKFRAILDEIGSHCEFGKAKGRPDTETEFESDHDEDQPPF